MISTIILLSLVVVLVTYALISWSEKSLINAFSPYFLLFVPSNYLFELVHIHYFGYSGSSYAYMYCYGTYAIAFAFFALSYRLFPVLCFRTPLWGRIYSANYFPYIILVSAFVVYAPILFEFREYLSDPREIYMRTRSGYGLAFFLSTTLAYLSFVAIVFKRNRYWFEVPLIAVACVVLLLAHGSKGQIVTLVLIYVLYRVYVEHRLFGIKAFSGFVVLFSAVIGLLFSLTLQNENESNLLKKIALYSDYTRNALLVIDSNMSPEMGRLTMEEVLFSRVPREFYSDKPKNFGTFYLAEKFYPEWFAADTGSPAFGIGVQYADFGDFAIVYIVVGALLSGVLLKVFMTRLKSYHHPADFIMVLFFSGITLIPIGVGNLLPEHLLIAFAVALLLRQRSRYVVKYIPNIHGFSSRR